MSNKEISIKKCSPFTLTNPVRMGMLWDAIETVHKEEIPGCFIEAGVYKGGSSMLAAYAMKHFDMGRDIFMFDTFKGMTEPCEHDYKLNREKDPGQYLKKWKSKKATTHNTWCYASYPEVLNNINSVGYAFFDMITGNVIDTVRTGMCAKIAVLRIDVDFYDATKHLLEQWYEQVMPGGYIIFDDYWCWNGTHKAVNEFFESNDISLDELVTVDHSCAYMRKSL
jgi:hypothetical protein